MKKLLLIALLLLVNRAAYASACTSAATGNWSAPGTWSSCGGGVPGSGDTASIGAHTVTVDVSTTIGTSPNDNTTKVVDITSSSGVLIVAASFTVKGNLGSVNGSTITLNASSSLIFDASSSGGTPVYTWVNGGFCKLNINGTSGSHVTLSAPSGHTFSLSQNYSALSVTYADFTRLASGTFSVAASGGSITSSTFTSCGKQFMTATSGGTNNYVFNYNTFAGSTGTESFQNSVDVAYTSGTREMIGNVFDKIVIWNGKAFIVRGNYFGGGISAVSTKDWTSFRLNFVVQDGGLNGGNGALLTASAERNYFVVDNTIGNPHFISPQAKSGVDAVFAQNVFEAHTPDLVDYGDVFLVQAAATSGGKKIIGRNNIVLTSSYTATTVSSGALLTEYNSSSGDVTEWYRNTCNTNNPSVGTLARRAMLALSEASVGNAGMVAAVKSNLVWGSSAGQGYVLERLTGTVKDLATAAGIDYNWAYNLSTGDNQRSYEDQAGSGTLWTAGDAVAASVDAHQGTGNPSFYDSARNLAAWATARGYGAGDYAAALTALQAAPTTRIPDLINYVFEGFRPGNATMRNAAHDGGVVGAANFYKSTRTLTTLNQHRAGLSKFGL